MKITNYKPLWRDVLISPIVGEDYIKTESNIYITKKAEKASLYKVLKVGDEVLKVKEKDTIVIDNNSIRTPIVFEDATEVAQIREHDIIGIYKEG